MEMAGSFHPKSIILPLAYTPMGSCMRTFPSNIKLIIILLLCSVAGYGQNNYTDSLKQELAKQKEDTNKVKLLTSLSSAYSISFADSGIYFGQQALNLAEKIHFEYGVFWAIVPLSASLSTMGNYPLSLSLCFKALDLAKKMNRTLEISFANGILSDTYYNLGDYSASLKYEQEVIKIAEKSYATDLYYMWIAMSRIYGAMNERDSALLYAKKAYEGVKQHQNPNNLSFMAPVFGNAFAGMAKYDSALFYYRMGIPVAIQYDFGTDLVDNYYGIAGVYKATNQPDSAIWYAKKILTGNIRVLYPVSLFKAANMLADIYESTGKSDSTLKYLRISIALKDSLFNREKTIAVQNLTYKEQEKQKEIEASGVELKNKFKMYFLLTALVILLGIAVTLFRNYRLKQIQNMRNSIAGDLHDDIGSTLTNISILSELSRQNLDRGADASKFLNRISEEVHSTSQALDDIIWSVNVHNDSVDEILLRMRRYAGELFDSGKLKYELRIDSELSGIKLSMDQRRDLYLIFKEALNNIYKHAEASQVTIDLNKKDHQIVMRIIDDGKGFESKPSDRNGFKNMQSRAEKRKGHLQIESALCKGTSVNLSFPLK
jgi:signal transduction histidine kinase